MQASISRLRTLAAIVAILGAGTANAQLFGATKPATPAAAPAPVAAPAPTSTVKAAPTPAPALAPAQAVVPVVPPLPAAVKSVTADPKSAAKAPPVKVVKAPVVKAAPKVASEASIKYLVALSVLLSKEPK